MSCVDVKKLLVALEDYFPLGSDLHTELLTHLLFYKKCLLLRHRKHFFSLQSSDGLLNKQIDCFVP